MWFTVICGTQTICCYLVHILVELKNYDGFNQDEAESLMMDHQSADNKSNLMYEDTSDADYDLSDQCSSSTRWGTGKIN
jgi:hypothetical protein